MTDYEREQNKEIEDQIALLRQEMHMAIQPYVKQITYLYSLLTPDPIVLKRVQLMEFAEIIRKQNEEKDGSIR